MANISIIGPSLNTPGGAEFVTAQVLKVTSEHHDVTFLTHERQDFGSLERFYHLNLDEAAITTKVPAIISGLKSTGRFHRLQGPLLKRVACRRRDKYDSMISTMQEAAVGTNGINYIHNPVRLDDARLHKDGVIAEKKFDGGLYEKLLERLPPRRDLVSSATNLCNSTWTKDVFEQLYDAEADVLTPPVQDDFDPVPWADRAERFVALGRIDPHKRQKEIIEILDKVREREDASKFKFIIAGSCPDTAYAGTVHQMVAERDWASIEEKVGRDRIVELLETSRYGIHNHPYERYGIAPVEMAVAGCIPFVRSSPGPADTFADIDVLFEDFEDAVQLITEVAGSENYQTELRDALQNIDMNTPAAFREQFADVFTDTLT